MTSANKKYRFTGKTIVFEGHTLHEIQYVNGPYQYQTGGWIEGEHNLSHEGNCHVLGGAKVFGNARIIENAFVSHRGIVKDNAVIKKSAQVTGYAVVGGDTIVAGGSQIMGCAKVFFYSKGSEEDLEKPHIRGSSQIYGDTIVEATGYILDTIIDVAEVSGELDLERTKLKF